MPLQLTRPSSQSAAPLFQLDGVCRGYPNAHVSAIADVSLSVWDGEFVAIAGPSGSGKSTLLHVLCGLDRPTTGQVLFEGQAPRSREHWTRLRARRIGFVFQRFHLLSRLTAVENVEIPMFGVTRSHRDRRRRAIWLLDRVGLASHADRLPGELSGGECQRVAIARSLANSPSVILADEPTGNLDSAASAGVLDLLTEIQRNEGASLVIASHDAGVTSRADRIVRLLDGRIVPPDQPGGASPAAGARQP
jgi:ABC-type lipoprotein export system ATPase subunit